MDCALPADKVHKLADHVSEHVSSNIRELRRLFLIEDLVDSIKVRVWGGGMRACGERYAGGGVVRVRVWGVCGGGGVGQCSACFSDNLVKSAQMGA